MIFNPELGADEPLLHGDEELPQPTPDIINIGENLNQSQPRAFNLVLFFDARRTWSVEIYLVVLAYTGLKHNLNPLGNGFPETK